MPKRKHIMQLGKPLHYLVTVFNRQRRACGAISGDGTEDRDKVDCITCRKTTAFRQP